jgi:hypothetical protein
MIGDTERDKPTAKRTAIPERDTALHAAERDAMEDITARLLRLPEPQCSPCKEAASEIEMLRQQWREMSSALMAARRENLHLKQELADAKRWAMSERAAKWDALARGEVRS